MNTLSKRLIRSAGLAVATFILGTWTVPAAAAKKVNVVATLPDFGAIAKEVGGDKVNVTSIAKGSEDPHFVDARPSFIRVLNQADVLLEGGAELEIGWLPPLIEGARNRRIIGDAPGRVKFSPAIRMLDVPAGPVDRSMGDVHPAGNPHFWLDPANGKIIASTIAATLVQVDAANAAIYQANLQRFSQRLDAKIKEWTQAMEPWRGTHVITYHKTYDYFLHRFGLELVATIEPKPGIEPSPTHISALIPQAREKGVKLIFIEPNRNRRTPEYLAERIGAKVLVLPGMVGGNEKVTDYISLFDYYVRQLKDALGKSP
ncbi:MAG: metal ABC transporter substrate-binding protein [Verrucomicrobia subdivision 3 bacterium]|nr:metal ABC transporter substrate-binding protein [Limisphaerales bacterium]